MDICTTHLLPWVVIAINEMEKEIILGVLETSHSLLLQDSDIQAMELEEILVSSSWFSFFFGCIDLYPTEKKKKRKKKEMQRISDASFTCERSSGQPIRHAALYLPSDPVDMLFLLG